MDEDKTVEDLCILCGRNVSGIPIHPICAWNELQASVEYDKKSDRLRLRFTREKDLSVTKYADWVTVYSGLKSGIVSVVEIFFFKATTAKFFSFLKHRKS